MSQAISGAAQQVRDIEFLGIQVRVHDVGAGEVCEFTAQPGPLAPPHRHAWSETHYVIEGEMEYMVGGEVHRVPAGGFLSIPGDALHALSASTPVRWLELTGDAHPSEFFELVSREANDLPPDMEKLAALAARYDVEVLAG